ncbi:MAG: alanine racemase [Firmicutes bacterium]|nr:alanine racemase [Bacillota bacterium]
MKGLRLVANGHFSLKKWALDTPAAIVDYGVLVRNIARMSERARQTGVKLRPHTKTHKSPAIAHLQLRHGASGITVAKLGEAEVMAQAGIDDILVAYPLVGEEKIRRLLNLRRWVSRVACTVDSVEAARALSAAALENDPQLPEPIEVYVEVDVGLHRVGQAAGEAAVEFAKEIAPLPGIHIRGLLTHAGQAHAAANDGELRSIAQTEVVLMAETARMIRDAGIAIEEISIGSTPTMSVFEDAGGTTEIRPGTYVFNDTDLVGLGVAGVADCALTVLATVISKPEEDRLVLDSGSKTLSSEKPGDPRIPGHGIIKGFPDLYLERLNEEHGMVRVQPGVTAQWQVREAGMMAPSEAERKRKTPRIPRIGEKVEIIPNHACVVTNLFDRFLVVQGDEVIAEWDIPGRGKLR